MVAHTRPAHSVWSLSPSPVSLLPFQVPLERHDGGIRLRDNQVSSLWSERRGQPLRAGRWRQRRGCGHCWRRCRQGPSSGRQQRRDEPCGSAALPAATGRSWRPSWATRDRERAHQASSHSILATWRHCSGPSSFTLTFLGRSSSREFLCALPV